MSSAANPNHDPIGQEFRSRMHEAEAKPSPALWDRIDYDLTVQESKGYRKRMIWYRQLAAACIVALITAGSLFVYHLQVRSPATAPLAGNTNHASGSAGEVMAGGAAAPAAKAAAGQVATNIKGTAAAGVPGNNESEKQLLTGKVTAAPLRDAAERPVALAMQETRSSEPDYTLTAIEAPSLLQLRADNIRRGKGKGIFTDAAENLFEEAMAQNTVSGSPPTFFRTARQAITSVPADFDNGRSQLMTTRRQMLVNPTVAEMLPDKQGGQSELFILNARELQKQAQDKTVTDDEDKHQKGKNKNRWVAGLAYAPGYFKQNIGIPEQRTVPLEKMAFMASSAVAGDDEKMREAQDEFEQNTDPSFSFAVDLKAGLKIGKKWRLFSGLGFTQNTARTKSSYIIKQFWLKPRTNEREELSPEPIFLSSLNNTFSTDSMSVDKTDNFYVNYRYRHLTLPVGAQYEGALGKKWSWYAAGSVAANLLLETSVMASNSEVKDVHYTRTDNSPFRKMQLSGNVSVGVARHISENISISAGPEFRGYIDTMLADPEKAMAPQGRPYTIGLNMGVNYDFGSKK